MRAESSVAPSASDGNVLRALFTRESTIQEHLGWPMLKEREAYLSTLTRTGRKPGDVAQVASMLKHVLQYLELPKSVPVSRDEVRTAARRWIEDVGSPPHRRLSPRMFEGTARNFVKFLGQYRSVGDTAEGFQQEFAAFAEEISKRRGYSPPSAASIVGCSRRFLSWLRLQQVTLADVELGAVDAFLLAKKNHGAKTATLAGYTGALRVFFDFAEQRGWSAQGISRRIESAMPRRPRQEPPSGPPWRQIRRMIASLEGDDPSQSRARAILLLAAVYGLRKAEISRLRLEDFDWLAEVVTVQRSKRGRTQQFPIQPELRYAVRQYIDRFRPECEHPELFVTLLAPYRPTLHLSNSMAKVMAAKKVFPKRTGLHALRHSCATELLRQGTSLRGIADFLGHKNLRTVSVYARCESKALRSVADFRLSEVL